MGLASTLEAPVVFESAGGCHRERTGQIDIQRESRLTPGWLCLPSMTTIETLFMATSSME
jgi:hypothetical protein